MERISAATSGCMETEGDVGGGVALEKELAALPGVALSVARRAALSHSWASEVTMFGIPIPRSRRNLRKVRQWTPASETAVEMPNAMRFPVSQQTPMAVGTAPARFGCGCAG